MSYSFLANGRYRMPTHFGPSLGPRQGINGKTYANLETPIGTYIQASFEANVEQLKHHLPPQFQLREPYMVNLNFCYRTGMEWLAGRGYNEFGVTVPVTYHGSERAVNGNLLLVIWENMADAIITGREDLGVAKLYCDIPHPQTLNNEVICRASWDGHQFASLKLTGLSEGVAKDIAKPNDSAGVFHYKYIPRTNVPSEADAQYVVFDPNDEPNVKLDRLQIASGATANFRHSTFEELPTLVHIVNALSAIDFGECMDANITNFHGGRDLCDLRIIK